ncbi:MarR family winged helix-turn-helix transcriptional regulator [Microbacterium karelineae]|uniref:MarR family winged helix-turn-helix transcriptional regulator n=1 Tax=Microbacterium karelineae TaxID=2654283 RepID=UPI0012E99922|nr:MarR family transcriptional regulator [Microbacterium karelineae]
MTPLTLDRLLQIGDLFRRDMERAFAGTALTPARVHLLWVVHHAGPSTQRELAEACGVSPRNITGLLDALERSGHVRRVPHPSDRRAVLVRLTDDAVAMMSRMQIEHADLDEALLSAVAPDERAAVERGIAAIAERLEVLVARAEGRPS